MNELIEEKSKLLELRMEYELVYGPDFWQLSEEMQKIVILLHAIELSLKASSTYYGSRKVHT